MDRESLRALGRASDGLLAAGVGFGLACLAIWALVVRAEWMPQGLLRILSVQRHLAAGEGPTGGVAVFGSSVVVEGLDCGALVAALPRPLRCENLAWTGGDVRQWLLVAPALAGNPPRFTLLGLDLFTLLSPDTMAADRLAIAAYWGFVPDAELGAFASVLRPEESAALRGSRFRQLLRLRGLPLNAWNERVRELARSDLRYAGYATNFTAPWVRRRAAAPTALAAHMDQVRRMIEKGGTQHLAQTAREIEFLADWLRRREVETHLVLVLTPVHPELAASLPGGVLDEVRRETAALAARTGAELRDDTTRLAASGFSDAVHPYGEGRLAWSRSLGETVAAALGR